MPARAAVLLVLIAALAAAAYLVAGHHRSAPAPIALVAGKALPTPRGIADFSLATASGKPLTRAAFEGRWSLLSIGFTHCPDVCPQTLMLLDAVATRVDADGEPPQTIFVSVDPDRDTPQRLAEYVGYFNRDFVGATGSRQELDRLCESLGFAYVRVPGEAGRYSVDHSTAVALIDPQARVAGYFTLPLKPAAMATDLLALPPARR